MTEQSRPDFTSENERASTSSDAMYVTHRGVVITVTARKNREGAWLADIAASLDGKPLDLPHVEPVTAEWLNESEALRAGIEHGCYLVDRFVPQR
jgi:hypothetical protein